MGRPNIVRNRQPGVLDVAFPQTYNPKTGATEAFILEICTTKSAARAAVAGYRTAGASVGLVPTMGYLHDGHLALVGAARSGCDRVVVSIFVNPTQFGANEDLGSYPRDIDRDLKLLKAAGVDAVFMPSPAEMYHPQDQTIVETTRLSRVLIGRLRPGHFRGVATVVCKLLNIVGPDRAYFGEKDYQQLLVIKTMVRDLDMPFDIHGVPTVRETDGLAMSSRNVKLTPEDRRAAVVLSKALNHVENSVQLGMTASSLRRSMRDILNSEPRADVRSVDVRDAATLAPVRGRIVAPVVVLLAVRFATVLLIDQRVLVAKGNADEH